MPLAVLGLGTNLGDRENHLAAALDFLEADKDTGILRLSAVYETEPFDVRTRQNNYLNCCVLVDTQKTPYGLLELCGEIEERLGRERREYHGARTMDVDILLYEGVTLAEAHLTIPHKGILARAFVLVPLADLFPQGTALGLSFLDALKAADTSGVWLYK